MKALYLADAPIVIADLIAATSSAVPDLRAKASFLFPNGWSKKVEISNQDQARQVHTLLFCRLVEAGEMKPRSPLTWVEADRFQPNEVAKYTVTFEEAQAFCRHLLIDLHPLVQKTQEERDADILAHFKRLGGKMTADGKASGGRRKALADLEREDGRARQTLIPILRRADAREMRKTSAIGSIATSLAKR